MALHLPHVHIPHLPRHEKVPGEDLPDHVRYFDLNNDGKISPKESAAGMYALGLPKVTSKPFSYLFGLIRGIQTQHRLTFDIDIANIDAARFRKAKGGMFDTKGPTGHDE